MSALERRLAKLEQAQSNSPYDFNGPSPFHEWTVEELAGGLAYMRALRDGKSEDEARSLIPQEIREEVLRKYEATKRSPEWQALF
jgi:hypothetical protein